MTNSGQVLLIIALVVITAIISAYLTKLYIKHKVKGDIMGLIPEDVASDINEKMCDGIVYLPYPVWEGEGLEDCIYSQNLAHLLIILCENVGTTNCDIGEIPLPDSFDTGTAIKFSGHNYAYIFYSSFYRTTFLIWSGTTDAQMAKQDGNLIPVSVPEYMTVDENIRVHRGFLNIYENTRDQILKEYNKYKSQTDHFVIAGHSLGGALTSISAFDAANNSPDVSFYAYTFGSPRCGNIQFAETYNNLNNLCSFRVFNTEDIVPTVPLSAPKFHYTHVGTENALVPFTMNLGTIVGNHVTAYLKYLR